MTEIRKLPATEPRVETGPIRFGDDWPGIFIRGDETIGYIAVLGFACKMLNFNQPEGKLTELIDLLKSCWIK